MAPDFLPPLISGLQPIGSSLLTLSLLGSGALRSSERDTVESVSLKEHRKVKQQQATIGRVNIFTLPPLFLHLP